MSYNTSQYIYIYIYYIYILTLPCACLCVCDQNTPSKAERREMANSILAISLFAKTVPYQWRCPQSWIWRVNLKSQLIFFFKMLIEYSFYVEKFSLLEIILHSFKSTPMLRLYSKPLRWRLLSSVCGKSRPTRGIWSTGKSLQSLHCRCGEKAQITGKNCG